MPKRGKRGKETPQASPVKGDQPPDHQSGDEVDKADLSWPERMLQQQGDGDKTNTSYSSSLSYSLTNSFRVPSNLDHSSQSQYSPQAEAKHRGDKSDFNVYSRPSIHEQMTNLSREEAASRSKKPEENVERDENDFLGYYIDYVKKLTFQHKHGVCIFIMILFCLITLYLWRCAPADTAKPPLFTAQSRQTMVRDFDEKFREVIEKFPSQDNRFWKVIKATCKGVLRESHPTQPAILMLAAHQDKSRTAECIARHVTRVFTGAYRGNDKSPSPPGMLSTHDYYQYRHPDVDYDHYEYDADGLKKHIDHSVRATFDGGSRAVHVSAIQHIPGRAAAMFHAFCDNDNAPYKDAAVVFTVHVDSHSQVAREHAVEDYLTELWGNDLDIDTLTPLLSRMANSIAIVQGESEDTLDTHCLP